jgi:cytochrome c-type biogenesis protein CcmH
MKPLVLIACCSLLMISRVSWAIDSEPAFANPVLERRYERLLQEIRCLQCMNENIANSDAPLAADFRRQIHAKVADGEDDQQIKKYMVNRYGDFVLYDPPLQTSTWLLWTGPFLLLGLAIIVVIMVVRRRAHMDEEQET